MILVIATTLLVTSSAPPLKPAEAAAVLRGSRSPQDLTDYRAAPAPTLLQVILVPSTPTHPAPPAPPSLPSFNNFVNGYPVNSIDDVREAITRARLHGPEGRKR